jgi:hypothetical protein
MKKTTALRAATAVGLGSLIALGGLAAPASAEPAGFDGALLYTPSFAAYLQYDAAIKDLYVSDREGGVGGWTANPFNAAGALHVEGPCGYSDDFGHGDDGAHLVDSYTSDDGAQVFELGWTLYTDCDDIDIDIAATVTVKGNYIRWEYKVLGDEDAMLTFNVDTTYAVFDDAVWDKVGTDAVVGSSTYTGLTPSAWKFSTDAPEAQVSVRNNLMSYSGSDNATYLTATLAVADATPKTGYPAAVAQLKALAPTLEDTFGETYGVFYGTDGPVFDATKGEKGVALDADIAYEFAGLGNNGEDQYFFPGNEESFVGYELGTLPAGVTVSVTFDTETGRPVVHVSGTPTEVGTFQVPLTFFRVEANLNDSDNDNDNMRFLPLGTTLDFEFADVAAPAVDDTKKLAETGIEGAPLGFGALALLVLGFGVIGARRARKA